MQNVDDAIDESTSVHLASEHTFAVEVDAYPQMAFNLYELQTDYLMIALAPKVVKSEQIAAVGTAQVLPEV